eukprot:Phypoly_transcript_14334.p1 GENE.Phypoly_transcript_14334~~Phypoly_transcript_14334.p1  ORF type:complete len:289 (-),score=65.94 Phypoly_transcript_14334:58-924(-)
MSSKILITGATGGVGRTILSQLLALSPQPALRVSSRDPSKLSGVPSSVEVVKGDLGDPSTYSALFQNVDKMFLHMHGTEKTAPQVVQGAKEAGVRHIVFLSSMVVLSPHDNYIKKIHAQVEDAIKNTGLTYTFLRPGDFATNAIMMWGPQIKYTKKIAHPFPNAYSVPIANEDTAAVAVIALTSSKLDNAAPVLTGPRSLTVREQIEAISKVHQETKGTPVPCEQITVEQWQERVKGKMPDEILHAMPPLWKATDGVPQPVSPDFEKITGRPGTQFEDWVRLHKDELF